MPGQASCVVCFMFVVKYGMPYSYENSARYLHFGQTLKYNPASWRVPYNVQVFKDPKQILVTYALQVSGIDGPASVILLIVLQSSSWSRSSTQFPRVTLHKRKRVGFKALFEVLHANMFERLLPSLPWAIA
jgi:hypothetical protein